MKLQGVRILIVEDEALVAMIVREMVKNLGGVVAGTARSVADAKKKIQEPRLDCVMLDVNLNGDYAFGIAAELEERAIPFVFCTAYLHPFERFEHVPRIIKPYGERDVREGLEAALRQKAAHRRPEFQSCECHP